MLTRSKFRVSLGAGVLGLLLTGAGSVTAQTVKVGMVVGVSGPGADIGESMVRGADLYLALHGKDLPSGVKVELIKRDDGSNPDRTKRLAQELVVRDKVQLLTGVTLSPQALTIAPVSTDVGLY